MIKSIVVNKDGSVPTLKLTPAIFVREIHTKYGPGGIPTYQFKPWEAAIRIEGNIYGLKVFQQLLNASKD